MTECKYAHSLFDVYQCRVNIWLSLFRKSLIVFLSPLFRRFSDWEEKDNRLARAGYDLEQLNVVPIE